MEFARFNVLYVLIGVFVVLFLVHWIKKNRYMGHSMANSSLLAAMRPSHLRFLPKILLVAGVIAAGIALMEPRITFKEGVTELEGLDIVMVVDLSSSMQEVLGGWEESFRLDLKQIKQFCT